MASSVEVVGADRLAYTLGEVGDGLGDLSVVNGHIADYVATRAKAYAPRLTGRLAHSITANGTHDQAVVATGVSYAGVQEFGWPGHHIRGIRYMGRASDESESAAVADQLDHVNDLLYHVKGA